MQRNLLQHLNDMLLDIFCCKILNRAPATTATHSRVIRLRRVLKEPSLFPPFLSLEGLGSGLLGVATYLNFNRLYF